jgi:HSP20 family molecular chaperone IbpA
MRDLGKIAKREGGEVEVEATAIAWDLAGKKWKPKMDVDFMKRAEYRVNLKLPGQPPQKLTITIDVGAPLGGGVEIAIDPPGAINLGELFPVPVKAP